jgi:hypothetical protein
MTMLHRRTLQLAAVALLIAPSARATNLIMPVNTNYNLDAAGPEDIRYVKDGNCSPATLRQNNSDWADGLNQGQPSSWTTQTYSNARAASYQGGGGFSWSGVYSSNNLTYLIKTAPPQVQYFKVRAIAFTPPFPCNPLDPPPHTGNTSMEIEFEELPVFKNGFETNDLEDWSSSTHPI